MINENGSRVTCQANRSVMLSLATKSGHGFQWFDENQPMKTANNQRQAWKIKNVYIKIADIQRWKACDK